MWDNFKIQRIVEIVQTEFPINIHAPTPAMVKAQQIPAASITQGSQLPTVNLGSPTSSSSKPKLSKLKIQSITVKPSSTQPKSKDKAKPKSTKAKSKAKFTTPVSLVKSKVKTKSSRDELLKIARLLVD